MATRSWPPVVALAVSLCIGTASNAAQTPSAPSRNQTPPGPAGKQPPPAQPSNQAPAAPQVVPAPSVPANQTSPAAAKQAAPPRNATSAVPTPGAPPIPAGVTTPADYLIGPEDVLTIVFWREKDMSGDTTVRPDGRISLPLINDMQAAGLTPEQLRLNITEAASKLRRAADGCSRGETDQQPKGVHHRAGCQARGISAYGANHSDAAHHDSGRPSRVCGRGKHQHRPDRKRPAGQLSLQL